MPAKKHRVKIYQSALHLAITLLIIVVPFLFLLFFSRLVHIATAKLFANVFISVSRLAIAYIISAALAWLLAVAFYKGKRANVALPIFDVMNSFPTSAALPIAAVFFGPKNFTVILFLILAILWPIIFSIISSLKLIKHDWEEAAEINNLSGLNYLKKFIFPVSLPGLITGSIVGLGDGWEAIVATEIIVGIKSGLGDFFKFYSANPTITIFGILGFLILIFTINKLIWLPLLDWSHSQIEE